MKHFKLVLVLLCFTSIGLVAQDWNGIPIPANAPSGMTWELNPVSDSFNYESNSRALHPEFEKRWNELYINGFSGPSATSYHKDHSWITGGFLNIHAAWDATLPIVYTGCISSKEPLSYPMYMEAKVKQAGCMLANNIWMISADETEELDMLESYPNTQPGREFLERRIHLSHHTFIRGTPLIDYQPRDEEGVFGTWYFEADRLTWRDDFFTIGVFWKNPHHAEYYINGKLVRTIKQNEHSFIDPQGNLSEHTTDFDAIDKYEHTGGTGLSKPQHIIINMEQQSWLTQLNIFPTPEDLDDANNRNLFLVDWIRVYDAVPVGGIIAVTGVEAEPFNLTIRPGETVDLTHTISPANASNQIVTWSVSNREIAKINGLGQVTGLSAGTIGATVTTFDGEFSDAVTVTVAGTPIGPIDQDVDVQGISIFSPETVAITEGETLNLSATIIPFNATVQTVLWATSNSSVAQIDNLGVISALAEGTTTITATSLEGDFTDSITVTVTGTSTGGNGDPVVSVTGVSVSPETLTIGSGQAGTIRATVSPANASDRAVTWQSSNTDVVIITNSGVVTGVADGTAIITATTEDGSFTATSTVTVGAGGPVIITPVSVDGGTLTGGPFTFTVGDGVADNVSGVSLSGNVGANSQYIVTDDQGVVLGLPPTPEVVNFDEAGVGTCFIYHVSYEGTLVGLTSGANISGLSGDFDLSNSIRVNRNAAVIVDPGTPSGDEIIIEAETFTATNGTFNDASAGGSGLGVNRTTIGINYVNSGDYADYTINVGEAGDYAITYLISTPSDNAQIQVAINGVTLATDNVPNNGDWEAYTNLTSSSVISLSTGVQTVRLTASGSNDWQWNLDKVTLTKQNGGTTPPVVNGGTLTGGPYTFIVDGIADNVSGVSVSGNQGTNSGWIVTDENLNILGLPPTPEVVNFDEAGVGVCLIWHISYEDGLTGLAAGQNVSGLQGTFDLSSNSVRVERNAAPTTGQNATLVIEAEDFDSTNGTFDDAFAGGPGVGVNNAGANINYVNSGDYVEYTINVATAGTYAIDYSISSPSDNAQIEFDVVGSSASTTTNVPNNGQWDSFGSLDGGSVALSAGSNTIRITATGSNVWQWNLDKITLSTGGSGAKNIDVVGSIGLSVYPNPSVDVVFIEGLNRDLANEVHVYNMAGAEFLVDLDTDNSINVEGLAKGVYFITVISTEKGKQTVKLIKN